MSYVDALLGGGNTHTTREEEEAAAAAAERAGIVFPCNCLRHPSRVSSLGLDLIDHSSLRAEPGITQQYTLMHMHVLLTT